MGRRSEVTAETVQGVSDELAGHPLSFERAALYAAALEEILKRMDELRRLPLKGIEPAPVFRPVEVRRDA